MIGNVIFEIIHILPLDMKNLCSPDRQEFLQCKFESLKGYACQFLVVKPFLTSDKHSRFSLSWPQCPSGRVMGQIFVYRLHPCSFPYRINRMDMSFLRLIRNLRKKQNHLRFNSVHFKDKPRVDENVWCCWLPNNERNFAGEMWVFDWNRITRSHILNVTARCS